MGIPTNHPAIVTAQSKGLIAAPVPGKKPRGRRTSELVTARCTFRFVIDVPLKTVSAANLREHWAAKHRRVQAERLKVHMAMPKLSQSLTFDRAVVTFTRMGGRKLDDDNLRSAMKGVRDEVSAWLKVDDGSERLRFVYREITGGPVGVRIEITNEETS